MKQLQHAKEDRHETRAEMQSKKLKVSDIEKVIMTLKETNIQKDCPYAVVRIEAGT